MIKYVVANGRFSAKVTDAKGEKSPITFFVGEVDVKKFSPRGAYFNGTMEELAAACGEAGVKFTPWGGTRARVNKPATTNRTLIGHRVTVDGEERFFPLDKTRELSKLQKERAAGGKKVLTLTKVYRELSTESPAPKVYQVTLRGGSVKRYTEENLAQYNADLAKYEARFPHLKYPDLVLVSAAS